MSDLAMLIFGFGFIFAMTTLGSSIVYFLKKTFLQRPIQLF